MPHPLLTVAREAIAGHLRGKSWLPDPRREATGPPAGCFVSLKTGMRLRGCMGTMIPTRESVVEEVAANAVAAATRDPRFKPLRPEELAAVSISIDLLSALREVRGPEELDPSRLGLLVRAGKKTGVLLPDLPGVDTAEKQIEICREKGEIAPDEPVTLECFTVERLEE